MFGIFETNFRSCDVEISGRGGAGDAIDFKSPVPK